MKYHFSDIIYGIIGLYIVYIDNIYTQEWYIKIGETKKGGYYVREIKSRGVHKKGNY